jgi:hypothetical protein
MEQFQILSEPPTKACHNCRRSRRRCDRSIPTCTKCQLAGQDCLGYGKLLSWTNSVASRGKMMGKTFSTTADWENQHVDPDLYNSSLTKSSKTLFSDDVSSLSAAQDLRDPIHQGLSRTSRFYLSYCKYPCFRDGRWLTSSRRHTSVQRFGAS